MPALPGSVHSKDRVGVVFMSDLVDFVAPAFAAVKPVGTVDDDPVRLADVLISVDNALRNDYELGIVRADCQGHHMAVGCRIRAIVPHAKFEVGGPYEAKQISLIDMFVRAASHSRSGRRDVCHRGPKLIRDFIMTKKLAEPAALVMKSAQVADDDVVDFSFAKRFMSWRWLLLHT